MPEHASPSAAMTWAVQAFRRAPGPLIGLAVVVAVLQLGGNLALQPVANALVECSSATTTGQSLACESSLSSAVATAVPLGLFVLVLTWLAGVGVYRAALAASSGEPPEFAMLWRTHNLGRFVAASLVSGLVIIAAALVLWAPAIALSSLLGGVTGTLIVFVGLLAGAALTLAASFLLLLAPIYALDRGLGPVASMRASLMAVRAHIGPSIVLVLVVLLVSSLGGVCFGALSIFTLPFVALFVVHMYRQFNGDPIT